MPPPAEPSDEIDVALELALEKADVSSLGEVVWVLLRHLPEFGSPSTAEIEALAPCTSAAGANAFGLGTGNGNTLRRCVILCARWHQQSFITWVR
jgi:hypothetical protein